MAFAYYKSVTIDHTKAGSSDSSNFPVAVVGTYTELKTVANGGHVQSSSGYDIYFYSDSGLTTRLAAERVSWSASTGAVEFHVKVPTLSHTADTVIYVAYGDSSISTDPNSDATYGKSAAWDTSFGAVYHFGDGSTYSLSDSTSNANNGAYATGTITAAAGQVGGALSINQPGTGAWAVAVGDAASLKPTAAMTVSLWGKTPTGQSSFAKYLTKGHDTSYTMQVRTSGNDGPMFRMWRSGGETDASWATTMQDNTWHHVVGVYDGAAVKLYVDGSLKASVGYVGSITASTVPLYIGGDEAFVGVVDEIRIASSSRSADWITAEYNNQSSPSTFYTMGTETAAGGSSFTKTLSETLTMTDLIIRSLTRTLPETVTITGTFVKTPTKTLTESTTISDVISRITTKLLSETATITDTLKRITTKVFAEVATITDAITSSKLAATASAALGALATFALGGAPLSGGQKTSGTLWTKTLTELATITDTLVKAPTKLLADVLTITDKLIKGRIFSEAVTVTDSLAKSLTRAFTEAITVTDTLLKTLARNFTESLTITDSYTALRVRVINLLESITVTDTLSKLTTKLLAETLTITDTLIKFAGKVLSLTESITITDTLIRGRIFTELIAVSDSILKKATKALSESVVITDTLSKFHTLVQVFTETITITDTLVRSIVKTLTESISISDLVQKFVNGSSVLWSTILRSTTSIFSNGSKNNASFTTTNKNTSNWTKEIKD